MYFSLIEFLFLNGFILFIGEFVIGGMEWLCVLFMMSGVIFCLCC